MDDVRFTRCALDCSSGTVRSLKGSLQAPPLVAKTQSAKEKQGVEKKKEEVRKPFDQALQSDGENVLAKPITKVSILIRYF
ncbi:hypothetical protein KIN20_022066 [Parelaphostrongylus tenuis]|uniref:Uncharacterized protein n=1 Tax=Parelaphostrongylus tenuis TaxID=148309 RepID=A0AAD5N5U9_PARTN|nr:hypothetical protein KIN20_022066 [Parelaphostrongylus tenuis]